MIPGRDKTNILQRELAPTIPNGGEVRYRHTNGSSQVLALVAMVTHNFIKQFFVHTEHLQSIIIRLNTFISLRVILTVIPTSHKTLVARIAYQTKRNTVAITSKQHFGTVNLFFATVTNTHISHFYYKLLSVI